MAAEREPGPGHNQPPVNGDEDKRLKVILESVLSVDDDIKELSEDKKNIWAGAKSLGYDVAAAKRAYKLFKMQADKRREQLERDEAYNRALGFDLI